MNCEIDFLDNDSQYESDGGGRPKAAKRTITKRGRKRDKHIQRDLFQVTNKEIYSAKETQDISTQRKRRPYKKR